jgi:hypothetical protein
MSLVNTLTNPPRIGNASNIFQSGTEVIPTTQPGVVTFTAADPVSRSGRLVKRYTVDLTNLKALGAFTTGDIILDILPPGSIIVTSRIKHSTSIAGAAGPISAATARLMFGSTALGAGAIDVYAATSTTDSTSVTSITSVVSPNTLDVVTNLVMRITQTGATTGFSDITAGSIDAWVQYATLS